MDQDQLSPALGAPGTAVIVTGGASGIGLASAEALAAVGRNVALWDIDGGKVAAQAEAIAGRFGVKALPVAIDLTDIAAYAAAIDASRAALGPLGGLAIQFV